MLSPASFFPGHQSFDYTLPAASPSACAVPLRIPFFGSLSFLLLPTNGTPAFSSLLLPLAAAPDAAQPCHSAPAAVVSLAMPAGETAACFKK